MRSLPSRERELKRTGNGISLKESTSLPSRERELKPVRRV